MIFAAIADWAENNEYPVDFMCTELEVSRSGYYAGDRQSSSCGEQKVDGSAGAAAVVS